MKLDMMGTVEAFRVIKEALGIDPETPLQRIVVELDCSKIPTVYIKTFGQRPLVNAVAGLFRAKTVEEVAVNPDTSVSFKEQ